jgi:hypothetical protein
VLGYQRKKLFSKAKGDENANIQRIHIEKMYRLKYIAHPSNPVKPASSMEVSYKMYIIYGLALTNC